MLKLELRPQPSRGWSYGSPLLALAITVLMGMALFALLGKDPVRGLLVFFWEPLRTTYAIGELMVKATPLLLIALGLAVCFRSNVWNIGAEGQFVMGAIAAGGVALMAHKDTGAWIVPALLVAGTLGGMAWAGVTALLRDRFNANEILVSLMLVYVATLFLSWLVFGPWKDPMGYNFPQTRMFERVTQIPRIMAGSRMNVGLVLALLGAALLWVFLFRARAGFAQQVGGLAPAAARYAGFSSRRALWTALLISGGTAGLAGALEVAGPVGQLTPHVPVGYGFAAIRDDEGAAEASGVPTLRLKLIATGLSGGFMGMAGAPLPFYVTYLDPASGFNLNYAVNAIAMPLIGGTSSWLGPVVGAILVGGLQEYLRVTISSAVNVLVAGVLMVAFVILAPQGIVGLFQRKKR